MDHSEVKHLPKVDHTPAELDEPSRLLLKAADLIERQGWCQNAISDRNGRVCFRGALIVASGHQPWSIETRDGIGWPEVYFGSVPNHEAMIEADRRVALAVGAHESCAANWNNAHGRTKDEVVSKMRAVALGL